MAASRMGGVGAHYQSRLGSASNVIRDEEYEEDATHINIVA